MIGTALLVVYYALPLDRAGPGTALTLVAGLAALGALVAWQVQAVVTSPSPRLRAAESLATSILLYVVLFAGSHTTLSDADPDAYTELLDRTDALYFTVSTLATVGFGDIAAVSEGARVTVTVQIVTGLVLLGLVARAFLEAAELGLQRTGSGRAGRSAGDGRGTGRPGHDDGDDARA
jgi:voltage-gated potassium channel